MNPTPSTPPQAQPGRHPAWLLALLALLACQAWLTLGLFGPGPAPAALERLLDDQPVVSGRHALHLYHGYLGARSLLDRGQPSCYDPAFHAGYPKTPVFDPGSRPAELFLLLVGAEYSPAAYKVGLAAVSLLVPLLIYLGARGLEMCRAVAILAAFLGMLVWWGRPGREALESGDVDLTLASLMILAQAGLLVRYHRRPGVLPLLGITLTGLIGWFAHPLVMVLLMPAFLIYYLSAGTKHRLAWHAPLLGGLALSVAANGFWLSDWVAYWWIRVPPCLDTPLLEQPCLQSIWEVPLWGGALDKALACALLGLSLVGLVLINKTGHRPAARLIGLSGVGFTALALAGTSWEPLGRLGSCQLLLPGLWFAGLPAAFTVARGLELTRRWAGTVASPVVVCAGAPVLVWLAAPQPVAQWGKGLARPRPLQIGLSAHAQAAVQALTDHTDGTARVLWEDRTCNRKTPHWSALLPLLTGRSLVGGLDADAGIEHATCGLVDGKLAGRPLAEWSDAELADYCRRYNIGWVVCSTAEGRERFARWQGAGTSRAVPMPCGEARLFTLPRPRSYTLAGRARWCSADAHGILLADAEPEAVAGEKEGQVVLSLHYQAGMKVRPVRVRVEPAYDPQDTIPFVRLRMKGPVGRVFITWEGR